MGVVAVRPGRIRWEARYGIETRAVRTESLRQRFNESQLALLEELNRADGGHLEQLREVVVQFACGNPLTSWGFFREPLVPLCGARG
jgi:hypothetical protein